MTESPHRTWAAWSPPGCRTVTLDGPDGRRMDLMLYEPDGVVPEGGWPCLVVLDGERFFGAVAGAAATLSRRAEKTGVTPVAVAAVAHRPDAGSIEDQRARDFTRHPCTEPGWERPFGEGEAFHRFLTDDLLSRVTASAPIDAKRLTLFGHSLAGLFVLETLETAPDLFARWISLSPSLWWRAPDPQIGGPELLVGCGEMETRRDMRDRIEAWARTKAQDRPVFRLAPGADHGSAPFALLPDALRHASCA